MLLSNPRKPNNSKIFSPPKQNSGAQIINVTLELSRSTIASRRKERKASLSFTSSSIAPTRDTNPPSTNQRALQLYSPFDPLELSSPHAASHLPAMKLSLCLVASALLAAASAVVAQNAATPAPTTPCPVIPGWEKPSPTPASSTPCPVIPGWEKCTEVSVEGDATYCIDGPVCSGAGTAPAGDKCPKKGAAAKKDCLKTLKSYADGGKCIAPMDAQCVKIKSGAWGCVFSAIATMPAPTTPCPVIPGWEKPTPTPASSTPCPVIPGWEKPAAAPATPAPTTPCPVIPGWEKPTPAPTLPTPCPVIPGWEKATPAPTVAVMPAATTAAPVSTPAPTTTTAAPVPPTPAPTTAAPVAVALAETTTSGTTETAASNAGVFAASAAGVAAVLVIAAVVVYKKRRATSSSSPTIYNGAVKTPV